MHRNKYLLSASGTILIVIGILLGLPILLGSEISDYICTLPKANAQDNPCLAQEATLSAMRVDFQQVAFQATLDALNYQATLGAASSNIDGGIDYEATISALQSEVEQLQAALASSGSVPPRPIAGLPLSDSFDTNLLGWDLTPRSEGVARLSRGQLRLTANSGRSYWQSIPNLSVGDQFYVEADVTPSDFQATFVGFALGDTNTGQAHFFGIHASLCCAVRWRVSFYDNQTALFATEYGKFWDANDTLKFALEASGGLYTLYVNGEATETAQITPYGEQLGFVVFAPYSLEQSASFDNLVVRQFR